MQLAEYADPESFLHACKTFLMKHEAANNLLLSSALSLARASTGRSPGLSYFAVNHSGKIAGAGMNVVDRRLLLSEMSDTCAAVLGKHLAERSTRVSAILGPESAAQSFRETYLKYGGNGKFTTKHRLLQLLLRPNDFLKKEAQQPEGLWRVARKKDEALLYQWTRKFVEECRHDESPRESAELVHRYIAGRQIFVWENNKGPVAMAGFSGLTPNGARINMVYTESRARGRGYAEALVAAVNRKLLTKDERKFCFLFVDADNKTAIGVYERIGYRPLGVFVDLK